jgi:UDP-N-acetylglucosamine acyltransferase
MPAETTIHQTAIVADGAQLGTGVEIGPYCVVGKHVALGDRVRLVSHVSVDGITEIGADTVLYPFASIGHPPQDLKYKGEASRLEIGERCQIRESVTMNPGTEGGGMLTKVGNDCLFMVGAHVAHDCLVGDHVILANNATLGGHVVVGDHALFGGLSAVRQFIRIGTSAMIGGLSGVEHDVIPYGLVMGDRARLSGLNLVGIERRGFSKPDIQNMRSAYRMLFGPEGNFAERVDEVAKTFAANSYVEQIIEFIRQKSKFGICQPESQFQTAA